MFSTRFCPKKNISSHAYEVVSRFIVTVSFTLTSPDPLTCNFRRPPVPTILPPSPARAKPFAPQHTSKAEFERQSAVHINGWFMTIYCAYISTRRRLSGGSCAKYYCYYYWSYLLDFSHLPAPSVAVYPLQPLPPN